MSNKIDCWPPAEVFFMKPSCVSLLIRSFCDVWPHAEFGPAHVVLGEPNREDEYIKSCLETIVGIQAKSPAYQDQINMYSHLSWEEIEATKFFLESLLLIPEGIRTVL